MFGDVDYRNFAFVLEVAVDAVRVRIRHCEFRTASEWNRGNDLRVLRIDNRGRISGVIENVNLTALRFVSDCVWILTCLDLRKGLERS